MQVHFSGGGVPGRSVGELQGVVDVPPLPIGFVASHLEGLPTLRSPIRSAVPDLYP